MNSHENGRYAHGTIAWTELFAGDVHRQRSFYEELFGWRFDARHRARSPANGMVVAALRPRRDALRCWVPFIAVDDIGAVRRAVTAASGTLHQDGELEDPLGGRFFVWDGAFLEGSHGMNALSGLAWNEVWTPNPTTTVAFYRQVVGWNLKEQPGFSGAPYTMFAGRDRPTWTHAGIRSFEHGATPSRWMSYFEVENCERSVESARALGARVTMPATAVAGVGSLATLIDLEGAHFGFMQSAR